MLSGIPTGALLVWLGTAGAQTFVGLKAWTRDRMLALSLLCAALLSVVGMTTVAFRSLSSAYVSCYYFAGFFDEVATASLMLVWLNDLRLRGRPRRQGIFLPFAVLFCAAALAIDLSDFNGVTGINWTSTHRFGHTIWLWIAFVIASVPAYMGYTMARPNRVQCLKIAGLSLYVATHSGLTEKYISPTIRDLSFYKTACDLLYFIPLILWFVSIVLQEARHMPSASLREEFAQ